MNDQYLRLQCLKMIVDGGSHVDRANPQKKAEAYYNFVMGKTKPVPKTVSLEELKSELKYMKVSYPQTMPQLFQESLVCQLLLEQKMQWLF